MKSRLLTLLLAGIFVFSLTACGRDGAPISSAPAGESTTTTTTVEVITRPNRQGTMNYVIRMPETVVFSTLHDYEAAMRTYTDSDTLYYLFKDPDAPSYVTYNFDSTLFDTLTGNGYFLLPCPPPDSTLTKAEFTDEGLSKFYLALSDGGSVVLTYRHDRRMNEEYGYPVHTPYSRADGVCVTHHHTEDAATVGYYSWSEHGAYCRTELAKTTPASADAFMKALSFKKTPTNA